MGFNRTAMRESKTIKELTTAQKEYVHFRLIESNVLVKSYDFYALLKDNEEMTLENFFKIHGKMPDDHAKRNATRTIRVLNKGKKQVVFRSKSKSDCLIEENWW
jgi:hypothetical protein